MRWARRLLGQLAGKRPAAQHPITSENFAFVCRREDIGP